MGGEDDGVPVPIGALIHGEYPGVPLGELQGRLEGLGQALLEPRLYPEAVHHDFYAVLALFFQAGAVVQIEHLAVDTGAYESSGGQGLEDRQVFSLPIIDDRRQQHGPRPFGQGHDVVHHLAHRLRREGRVMIGTARLPDSGKQQAEIVVDLRDRAHRRPWVVGGGFLLDGDGRGQTFDVVHVGLFHHGEKLPCVGGQGLYVAPLSFGV